MKLSVSVMAHRDRAHYVDDFLTRLDASPEVIWDEKNDRWHTGRRALLSYDPLATHHLVLQDDVIPCLDLVRGLRRAIRYSQDNPVVLYTARTRPHKEITRYLTTKAEEAVTPWLVMPGPIWGPGVLLPTHLIPEIVKHGDRLSIPNYDTRIFRHLTSKSISCWYTHPSLIEHRHGPDAPSLIPGRNSTERRSWEHYIGSALDIDWSVPPFRFQPNKTTTRNRVLFRSIRPRVTTRRRVHG